MFSFQIHQLPDRDIRKPRESETPVEPFLLTIYSTMRLPGFIKMAPRERRPPGLTTISFSLYYPRDPRFFH